MSAVLQRSERVIRLTESFRIFEYFKSQFNVYNVVTSHLVSTTRCIKLFKTRARNKKMQTDRSYYLRLASYVVATGIISAGSLFISQLAKTVNVIK